MSHTPGPWTYRKTTGHHVIVIESDYMRDDVGCIVNALTEQDADNARLIAAAPELLEACRAGWAFLTGLEPEMSTMIRLKMLNAISKAEKPLDRSEEVK